MDLEAIRQAVDDSPHGIRVRMIDGHEYKIPHRDYIALGPRHADASTARRSSLRTSFIVYEVDDVPFRILNAPLVAHVEPLKRNGKSHRKGGPKRG